MDVKTKELLTDIFHFFLVGCLMGALFYGVYSGRIKTDASLNKICNCSFKETKQ